MLISHNLKFNFCCSAIFDFEMATIGAPSANNTKKPSVSFPSQFTFSTYSKGERFCAFFQVGAMIYHFVSVTVLKFPELRCFIRYLQSRDLDNLLSCQY